jgi:hypothetical protein
MKQNLKRVIYVSEHNEYSNDSLREIINSSRENNPGQDITGCLISGSNSFLQLLEGPASSVDGLYLKIKQDNRHKNIDMIIDETIEIRLFSSWSMKLDPFNNLMWSDEELNAGNFLNLTSRSALNIFTRISEDGKAVF